MCKANIIFKIMHINKANHELTKRLKLRLSKMDDCVEVRVPLMNIVSLSSSVLISIDVTRVVVVVVLIAVVAI